MTSPAMFSGVTRREFMLAAGLGLTGFAAAIRAGGRQPAMPAAAAVDHLIVGIGDLDAGIAWFESRTGVRPVVGGSHPGRGTRNALLALTGRQYVEIIAPDPAQDAAARPDLRVLAAPLMIGWAAATTDVAALAKRMGAAGIDAPEPRPGSRARPDGSTLQWTTLPMPPRFKVGTVDPVPFFIEWSAGSAHPSQDSPKGCELVSLEFEHTDADGLRRTLATIGIEATVRASNSVRIRATLKTPKGPLVLA